MNWNYEKSESGVELYIILWRLRFYFRRRAKHIRGKRYIAEVKFDGRLTHRAYIDFRTGSLFCKRCGLVATMHQLMDAGTVGMREYCTGRVWMIGV